jgi:hypothetical protein
MFHYCFSEIYTIIFSKQRKVFFYEREFRAAGKWLRIAKKATTHVTISHGSSHIYKINNYNSFFFIQHTAGY